MRTTWLGEDDGVPALSPEWRDLPRGTRSKIVGPLRADVWCVSGEGWRWTLDRERVYLAAGVAETEVSAKAAAEHAMREAKP